MTCKILVLLCFALAAADSNNTNNAWKVGYEYNYDVFACTMSGYQESRNYTGIVMKAQLVITPKTPEELIAKIAKPQYAQLQGMIPDGDCRHLIESQRTHFLHFAPLHSMFEYRHLPISTDPFKVLLKNGIITKLQVNKDVPNWEINIIKGMISNFKIDTKGENAINSSVNQFPEKGFHSAVFKTMEETVTGNYQTLYELKEMSELQIQQRPELLDSQLVKDSENVIKIMKTKNFDDGDQRIGYHYGLGNLNHMEPFTNQMGNFFTRASATEAIILGTPSQYTIHSSTTKSEILVSPLLNSDEKLLVLSQYNLILTKYQSVRKPLQQSSEMQTLESLVYRYNGLSNEDENESDNDSSSSSSNSTYQEDKTSSSSSSDSDFSSIASNESLLDMPQLSDAPLFPLLPLSMGIMGKSIRTYKSLNLIKENIKMAEQLSKELNHPPTILQAQMLSKFVVMTTMMRVMNAQELQEVANILHNNQEQSQSGNSFKIFCDALAECGTGPSLLTLEMIIKREMVSPEIAAQLVGQMAQSTRQPSEDYMKKFYMLTIDKEIQSRPYLNVSSILAYAQLIRNVYVDKQYSHNHYPSHIFGSFQTSNGMKFVLNEYIPQMIRQLHSAMSKDDHHKASVYIKSLGIVGHRSILAGFEPYLEGYKPTTILQRVQMVDALSHLTRMNRKVARSVLFKICQNSGEHSEVRLAALHQLVKTKPSVGYMQRLAILTNVEDDEQLNSAIKSFVQSSSQLESYNMKYTQFTGDAVDPLLSTQNYGVQYAKHNMQDAALDEMNVNLLGVLKTVGSTDSFIPKVMQYYLQSDFGGFEKEAMNVKVMMNSVEELFNSVYRQTRSYKEQLQQLQNDRNLNQESAFSSKNIFNMLNIEPKQHDPLDGSLRFSMGGALKYLTFNENNIKQLVQAIQDLEEALQEGTSFEYNKFINRHDLAMSVPTETGLPCLFTLDNPVLINLDGEASGDAEPKICSERKLRQPKSVNISSEVNVVFANKAQGQIGFITPFDHQHYYVGYDRSVKLHLPLRVELFADIQHSDYTLHLRPIEPKKDVQILEFSSFLYIGNQDIVSLLPPIDEKSSNKINSNPKTVLNTVIGQQSTGVAMNVHFASDQEHMNLAALYRDAVDQDPIQTLMSPLHSESLNNVELNVEYNAKLSSNHLMKLHVIYEQHYESNNTNQSNTSSTPENDVKNLFNMEGDAQVRREKMYKSVREKINNPTVGIYDASVIFRGDENMEYGVTAVVGTSDVDPVSNIQVYAYQYSYQKKKYNKATLSVISKIPNTNGLDPIFSLKFDPKSIMKAHLAFGQDYNSASTVNLKARVDKSHARVEFLHNQPIAHRCYEQIKQGVYQLPACANLTANSNLMDRYAVHLQYDKISPEVQNYTQKLFDAVRNAFYYNLEMNEVNPRGSGAKNQISVNVNYHCDFNKLNLSMHTPNGDYQFDNVDVNPYLRPVVAMHPVFSAQDRLLSQAFGLDMFKPYCVVDKNYANTVDNKTYLADLGNKWTIMMIYVPSVSSGEYHQQQQQQQRYYESDSQNQHENNQLEQYAVLVRDSKAIRGHKETKITLRAPQSHHNVIEIDLLPLKQTSDSSKLRARVLVNHREVQINSEQSTDLYKGFVKMYGLPNGELKIDVDDAFYVLYDGERMRLAFTNPEKFRDSMRGLCGTFTGDESTDFMGPQNCIFTSPKEFVEAYQLSNQTRINKNEKNSCIYPRIIFANVISDQDVGRQPGKPQQIQPSETYMKHQTRYIIGKDSRVCFTVKPLLVCKPGCRSDNYVNKQVGVHCVKRNKLSENLMEQINKGYSPDFSLKEVHKKVSMPIPLSCFN